MCIRDSPYAFLQEQGWLEQADTYGELLFVLEPGQGGWGTPDSEAAYLEACLGEVIGNEMCIRDRCGCSPGSPSSGC